MPNVRIDTLQGNLKSTMQQLSLVSAQLEAQKRETRAALETLAEAEVSCLMPKPSGKSRAQGRTGARAVRTVHTLPEDVTM